MKRNDETIQTGYLGTYDSPESPGIFRFTLNRKTGELSKPTLCYRAPDSKYLSIMGNLLAAPVQGKEKAGVCLLDTGGGRESGIRIRMAVETEGGTGDEAGNSCGGCGDLRPVGTCFQEHKTSCFIVQDDERIYTANYHEGTVRIYGKTGEGPVPEETIAIGPGSGCHQVLLHGKLLLVPCLLLDQIRIFIRGSGSDGFQPAGAIRFRPGTGPRHGVFTKDGKNLFVVSERSNELFWFRAECGETFRLLSVQPIIPGASGAPATAAIRLSADERFLYVSTRFADVITVFALGETGVTLIQQTGSGGAHPRDILLTQDGGFLLAANRTAGGLACFELDPATGRIGMLRSRVPAPEAVSIVLEN